MTRFLLIVPFILFASAASAQQGQDACGRDASRFCRAHLGEGDQVVLACLKQNRARLSKGCQALLASHGQ
ncbi:MAG: cysteine rich repeat-containing protein [Pseudomonadota bacterium]